MAQTIKIKRSFNNATPSSLEAGELAYSFKSDTKKLYIGDNSNNVLTIGGQAFTDKLDGIEAGADVTDATNVNAAGAVMNTDTTTASMSFVIDEDNMSSNTATKVPTQQSVKAYVDTEIGNLSTGVTSVSGTAPIVSSGGASPAISISLDNVTVEKNTSNNKLQAKTGTVVDNGTALATGDQIHSFVTGQGYVTTSGVTSISSTTTNQLTVTNGSSASPSLAIETATVADNETALATGDQIHAFVTGQNYITLSTLSNATNVNFSELTFTGSTIKSAETMTLDPATHGNETGTVVIEGDLTVKGTTTTVNSTTVEIGDNILKLNKDYSGSSPSADAGLEIERGTQTNAFIVWDESADRWSVDPGTGTLSPLNVENVAIDGGTF